MPTPNLKPLAGIDHAGAIQNVGTTMQFMVFSQHPSGPVPPEKATIAVNLKQLRFQSSCTIKDVPSGKVVGTFSGEFAPEINWHGAGLYKISAKK